MLTSTLVVDSDTTLYGVQKDTVAFSSSVLIKRTICSYQQSLTLTPHEWLRKTIHDKQSKYIITVASRSLGATLVDRCSSPVVWWWTVGPWNFTCGNAWLTGQGDCEVCWNTFLSVESAPVKRRRSICLKLYTKSTNLAV